MKRDFRGFVCALVLAALVTTQAVAADDIAQRIDIAANGGKVILTIDNEVHFVPAGLDENIAATRVPAYTGSQRVVSLHPANGGVVTLFDGGDAYFSADGMNLGGGGGTVKSYSGSQRILGLYSVAGGVVTWFSGGGVYFSPTGTSIGGGESTIHAYEGTQQVVGLHEIEGVLQTRFSGGGVYASSTGTHLGGGGSSVTLPHWVDVSDTNGFGPRDSARGIEFDGKLWLSGGFYAGAYSYYDLWYSADGLDWQSTGISSTPLTSPPEDAVYPPYNPLLKVGADLFAIGSSVWHSFDGLDWTLHSSSGPTHATEDTFAFHLADRFVFLHTQYGRVYTSQDGVHWSQEPDIPGFQGRCGALVTQAQGRIWVMGGGACNYSTFYDDIWYSSNGIDWTQVPDVSSGQPKKLEWSARMWPCVTVSPAGTLWMFGGFVLDGSSGQNLNDVWYSKDGLSWHQTRLSGPTDNWRHAPTCYSQIDKGRIIVAGGKGAKSPSNDDARTLNDLKILIVPVDDLLP